MSDSKSELHGTVLNIVHELEAAADGNLYRDKNGNCQIIYDIDEWKKEQYAKQVEQFKNKHSEADFNPDEDGYDTYEEWMEDEIGVADDVDEPDEVSLGEYIEDNSLGDVRFEVDEGLDLYEGKVLFCYGGPNVWVADDEVRGYWGSECVEMSLDSNARSALFSWFEDRWAMVRDHHSL